MSTSMRLLPSEVLFLFLQALKQAGYWKIPTQHDIIPFLGNHRDTGAPILLNDLSFSHGMSFWSDSLETAYSNLYICGFISLYSSTRGTWNILEDGLLSDDAMIRRNEQVSPEVERELVALVKEFAQIW